MAVPVAAATVSGHHMVTIPYDELPFTLPLSGAATNTPITEWEWVCIPSGIYNKGSSPYGSFLPSGVNGTWTNGVNKNQNPLVTLDEPGGYCFSLRARNGDGWSDPSYDGDGSSSQAITFILTPEDTKLPAAQQYDYDRDLNETLNTATSGLYIRGQPIRNETPTQSGLVLAWDGSAWGPQESSITTYSLGRDYFLRDIIASGIAGYFSLTQDPSTEETADDSVACVGGGGLTWGTPVLIESYVTLSGDPDTAVIRQGVWSFHFYGYISSVGSFQSRLVYKIYKRSVAGTETELFSLNGATNITSVSAAAPTELINKFYAPEYNLLQTDRLVLKVYAQTNSNTSKTIHYLHAGNNFQSHFGTPILGHTSNGFSGDATSLQGYNINSSGPTISGQILTWNQAQAEYKPQVPFTNELLGKPLASVHPTVSGQIVAWDGSSWQPQTIANIAPTSDDPPTSPNAKDDEFNGTSLNSKWTWIRAGEPSAASGNVSEGWGINSGKIWARIIQDSSPRDQITDQHTISQPSPSGNWTATTKVYGSIVSSDYPFYGIFTDDGSNSNIDQWKVGHGGAGGQYKQIQASWLVGGGFTPDQLMTISIESSAWLRIKWDGTKLTFYTSSDGLVWSRRGIHTIGYTPTRFGLFWHSNSNGGSDLEMGASFEYFRVTEP